uniref:Uncharacterized protein n=1 Tax=Opuntia streptacantha TaxID=393608 RepID=A0A7C8YKG8_OPUST
MLRKGPLVLVLAVDISGTQDLGANLEEMMNCSTGVVAFYPFTVPSNYGIKERVFGVTCSCFRLVLSVLLCCFGLLFECEILIDVCMPNLLPHELDFLPLTVLW